MRPFLWFFSSRLVLAPLSAKRVRIIRRNIIFTRLCRKIKEGWILARKPYEPWLNQKTLTATLIHLLTCSIESSGRSPLQDDWHVSFQITDTKVNPNPDSGADCNVMSHSLFGRLLVANKQAHKCKVKLKVCDGRRITSKGKVILAFECKGKYSQCQRLNPRWSTLTFYLWLKSSLKRDLTKTICSLEEELPRPESEYEDVFKGPGEVRRMHLKIQIDLNIIQPVYSSRRVPLPCASLTKNTFSEWKSWDL